MRDLEKYLRIIGISCASTAFAMHFEYTIFECFLTSLGLCMFASNLPELKLQVSKVTPDFLRSLNE